MTRNKVNLQYIPNGSTRRGTFQKRSHGMMKKAGELATLCDAKACVIIYGEGESVPQVYPSHHEAVSILNRFKDMPEQNQYKKTMDQESFLLQRIAKLQKQVQKSQSECEEREIKILLHKVMMGKFPGLLGLSIEDVAKVGLKVEVLLKSISDRITKIQGHPPIYQPSPVQAPGPIVTNGMDITSNAVINLTEEPSQTQEGWFDMVRSGGGDIGTLVRGSFKGITDDAISNSSFNIDEMIQTFNLCDGPSFNGKDLFPDHL
jgi:hypothetical protein